MEICEFEVRDWEVDKKMFGSLHITLADVSSEELRELSEIIRNMTGKEPLAPKVETGQCKTMIEYETVTDTDDDRIIKIVRELNTPSITGITRRMYADHSPSNRKKAIVEKRVENMMKKGILKSRIKSGIMVYEYGR